MRYVYPLYRLLYNYLTLSIVYSYLSGDIFVKDNLAINASGIAMRNNPKTFNLEYEELEIGETIGRGCSSVVLHGIHAPTGTQLALKVINMFDKSKRDQLIREIRSLYDAQCSRYILYILFFNRFIVLLSNFLGPTKHLLLLCLA